MDNDLSPQIASALSLFGIVTITHVQQVHEFKNRQEGVEDPEIIRWCRNNGYTWITHDIKAKKKHQADLIANRISVLWLRGQGEKFSSWQQFKVIVRIIDRLHEMLSASHGAMHFEAGARGYPTPKVIWTESPLDRPRDQR